MKTVSYYSGGFIPAAAAQNRAEEADSVAATFTTWDKAGVQTSQRALTATEVGGFSVLAAQAVLEANADTIRTKAQQALTINATFLAIATPTAAQIAAQTRALTKECNAIIRLLVNQLDDISGT